MSEIATRVLNCKKESATDALLVSCRLATPECLVKESLSATVNLIERIEERLYTFELLVILYFPLEVSCRRTLEGIQLVSRRELDSGITPLLYVDTTLPTGQGESRGCRRRLATQHKAITVQIDPL